MLKYLLLIGTVMVIGILLNKVVARIPVPSLLIFIALGMLFGENGPIGIPFDNYSCAEVICAVGLILIMFYGGFGTNITSAREVVVKSGLLASLGVCLTALMTMVFCHYVLKLSWLEGFLIGSVISSTDAASVFHILRSQNLSLKYNTDSLLEVESGSNDPASFMLTVIACTLLSGEDIALSVLLFKQVVFGVVTGLVFGRVAVYMLNHFAFGEEHEKTVLVLAIALLSYGISTALGGNGYLSSYLCGIYMGNRRMAHKRYLVHFFDALTSIAQLLIFFVLGLLVTPVDLPKVILPSAGIMIFMTFLGRPLVVWLILKPFRATKEQIAVVSFAGLRGVASICFAIYAMLFPFEQTYNLYNLVMGVVLLSLSFQGTLLPFVCRKCAMIDAAEDVRKTFNDYQEVSDVNFTRIHIGQSHTFQGKKIKDIMAFEDLLVALIVRDNTTLIPNGETVIRTDDVLVLAGREFAEQENIILREKEITRRHIWNGKTLGELRLPKETLIVMVQKPCSDVIPTGDTVIEAGDVLVMAETGRPAY